MNGRCNGSIFASCWATLLQAYKIQNAFLYFTYTALLTNNNSLQRVINIKYISDLTHNKFVPLPLSSTLTHTSVLFTRLRIIVLLSFNRTLITHSFVMSPSHLTSSSQHSSGLTRCKYSSPNSSYYLRSQMLVNPLHTVTYKTVCYTPSLP